MFLVAGDGSNTIHVGDDIAQPVWSADGSRLAFIDSAPSLYVLNLADWSIAIVPGLNAFEHPALSPDGETIAFECMIDAGNRDICAVHADGTGFVRLTSDPGLASLPASRSMGRRSALLTPTGSSSMPTARGSLRRRPATLPCRREPFVYVSNNMVPAMP